MQMLYVHCIVQYWLIALGKVFVGMKILLSAMKFVVRICLRVTTLIITGIHTHICIKHTSYGAFTRGYNIIIPEDAVNAFTKENYKSGLSYIKSHYGAKIMRASETDNDIIKELERKGKLKNQ
jgi:nicotinamidase-related amidase